MDLTRSLRVLLAILLVAGVGSCTRETPPQDAPAQAEPVGPRIINVLPLATSVGVCRRVEIEVEFEGSLGDPFDRDDVCVWANVHTPSGRRERIDGFLYDRDAKRAQHVWRLRYAPRELGEHAYRVHVRTRHGQDATGPFRLDVLDDGALGFVRVSRADPTMFEHSRGRFFYPFGQNVCWAADYEHYFRTMRAYGANWVRIWMCPWNLWLEGPSGPGVYDLDAAKRLDRIVELAERYGLHIQLVFDYHEALDTDWEQNPYNVENGGPCAGPEQFWTSGQAKRLSKRRLDYIVARWGASENIFAWELFNEANLTRRADDRDVVAWHREMAAYLVTTSTSGSKRDELTELWSLDEIDFTQSHLYGETIFDSVRRAWLARRTYNKPYFIGEFGRGGDAADEEVDPDGILLSAVLWLAATTPAAGNAMPWWWDTHIDPNDLYHRFAAVARFLDDEDRRGRRDEFLEHRVELSETEAVRVQVIANRTSALAYAYNAERIRSPDKASEHPAVPVPLTLEIGGLVSGTYRVELWHAETGQIAYELTARVFDGRLLIQLRASTEPLAVKATRVGKSPITIDLMRPDE